jgi:hypothetical protein
LRRIGRVSALDLVVDDKSAFVLGHERGVAELGGVLGLALADGPGFGVGQWDEPVGDGADARES